MTNKPFKSWTQHEARSSWSMFKIMAEFVEGFEKMEAVGPCISIFGSARTKPGSKYYEKTVELAQMLAHEGYGIMTGGGPGIMEAGNKGAYIVEGKSVGMGIDLPHEQGNNQYIDHDKMITFNYFFVRKVMLVKYAQGVVLMPGGFGTMDELFETITLVQTKKINPIPLVLVGTEYWGGLKDWIKNTMLAEGNINPKDLDLIHLTDDLEEVVDIINDHYLKSQLKPNF